MTDLRDHPTAVRAGEEFDLARLEPFLLSHFPSSTGPLAVEQFPSGHSNLTYLVRLGDREMVLRRPPFGSKVKTAHDMGREYRVLSKLHSAYPAAPKVLLYCGDESILGSPFYVMEPIRGIIIRRDPPPALSFMTETARRLSESLIDNLARLHALDYVAIGRDVSNMVFYLAFARFKVAAIVQQIYYRYHQGLTKDQRFASMPEVVKVLLRASLHSAESGSI